MSISIGIYQYYNVSLNIYMPIYKPIKAYTNMPI